MNTSFLSAAWHVAANDLRLILRDKATLFWSFIGPVMFITFFGLIFNSPGRSGPRQITIHLDNQDSSNLVADAVAAVLSDQNLTVERGDGGEDRYTVVVPAGATRSLATGEPPAIVMKSPNETPTYREQALLAATFRSLLAVFMNLNPRDTAASLDSAAIHQRVVVPAKVHLSETGIQLQELTQGFQRYVPSYMVMFLLMNSMAGGAIFLIMERKAGQLRRTLVSSVGAAQVIFGKVLSRFAWSWLQIAFMVLLGAFVYRIRFGDSPVVLMVILVLFTLCATALGMFYATLFRDAEKAAGVATLLVLVLSALGGLWWPIEVTPAWMQQLGSYLPTNWAFDALNRTMAFDIGFASINRHLTLMLVLTVVCMTWASIRLNRSSQT